MALLIIGLILFLGAHLAPTFTDFHADLVRKLGEKPYKGVFSLISLAGFVLIIFGDRRRMWRCGIRHCGADISRSP